MKRWSPAWIGKAFASFFSSRVEDSYRLRIAVLAAIWICDLGLVWAGGDIRYCVAGGILGTVGHAFSFRMRHRPSRARTIGIAVAVVLLSILMRNQMLQTFNGNWVPVAHYLVLVSGISAFDLRTRGGLYTGLVLSGTVLFFASQQAFDYTFGVFVIAFIVVLLGFLVLSFLEDGLRAAQVHWPKGRPYASLYWVGVACALFVVAGLAFWAIPRGNDNLIGPPQLAVLPYSPNDLESGESASISGLEGIDLRDFRPREPVAATAESGTGDSGGGVLGGQGVPNGLQSPQSPETRGELANPGPPGGPGSQGSRSGETVGGGPGSGVAELGGASSVNDPVISAPVYGPNSAPGGRSATGTTAGPNGTEPIKTTPPYALQGDPSAGINDEVVFHVRSNVASYWRSKVLGDFDGTYWLASGATNNLVKSESATGYWFDEEALDVQARYRYPQTFFPLIDEELPIFTGYQGLQVVTTGGDTDASLFAGGETYRVVSALPEHTPTRLRRDRSRSTYWGLTDLPEGSERLVALAERLSEGAISDFEKLERILAYVAEFTEFDPNLPAALTSSTSLNGFLFEEEPGSVLDHATATIMLARALQMPARLAVGYLPGTRDPLTGTYKVRQGDAHAWAEVHFRRNGWVPFDSAPRATLVVGDRAPSGVGRLFHAGLGEEVYGPLRDGPGQAFRTLAAGLPGPLFLILGLSLGLVVLVARWFQTKSRNPTSQRTQPFPRYSSLTGDGRKEIRRLYLEAEKLLRRRSGRKREAWQTVGGYTSSAGGQDPEVQKHLSWLTWALWHSAYRPGDLPFQLVSEARHRLSLFKSAFRAAKKRPPSEVGA